MKRGELWWADLGERRPLEQTGRRPDPSSGRQRACGTGAGDRRSSRTTRTRRGLTRGWICQRPAVLRGELLEIAGGFRFAPACREGRVAGRRRWPLQLNRNNNASWLRNLVVASREFLHRLSEAESRGQSFAVETTLSSTSYAARIRRWSELGYSVTLHFIELPSADYAVSRVATRAALGGHSIPEPDIRRRFDRGIRLLAEVYKPLVPEWYHWLSDDQGLRLAERSP